MFKFIITFFLAINIWLLKAQIPNPVYFNSASNSTATGTLSVGVNDLNWQVSMTGSLSGFVPAVSCDNQAPCCWMSTTISNANWITYPHTCSSSPAEHSCLGTVDEYYKLSFNLPPNTQCGQPITQPNAFCLAMDLYADNCVWEIFVNGVSKYLSSVSNPYYYPGHMAGNQISPYICSNWVPGINDVIIHVKSGTAVYPTWTGLLAIVNATLSSSPASYTLPVVNTNTVAPICNGSSANLTATGASSYTWNPGGYVGSTYSVSPAMPTTYTVDGTGPNGCVGSATVLVNVSDCTGISKFTQRSELIVYPNPTTGYFNISGINEIVTIEVINSLGVVVYSYKAAANSVKIDLNEQPKGVYFVKVSGVKSNLVKKIIKE